MLHLLSLAEVYRGRSLLLWLVSAFKVGFINSAGFLITGKFVSHITGFGTQVGIALGHKDYFFGAELLIIPISFISGGVIASYCLEGYEGRGEIPPYWKVQTLITLLLLVVIIIGEQSDSTTLTQFDSDSSYALNEFLIIGLLCLICGLKNGLVSWTSYGKIKVTHLTGLSTDIGINFLSMFQKKGGKKRFDEPVYVNVFRIMLFFCFSVGALLSAIIFPRLGFFSLFIPLAISLIMTGVSLWCAHLFSLDLDLQQQKNR